MSFFGGGKTKTVTTNAPQKVKRRPQRRLRLSTGNSTVSVNPGSSFGDQPVYSQGALPALPQRRIIHNNGNSLQGNAQAVEDRRYNEGLRAYNDALQRANQIQYSPSTGIDASASLDPRIREQALAAGDQIGQLSQGNMERIQALRSSSNPFVEARTRPLVEARDRQEYNTRNDFSRRGVFGSILDDQIGRQNSTANQSIADQRAIGEKEAEQAVLTREQFGAQLASATSAVSQQLLSQELAALGLSDAAIARMLQDERVIEQAGGGGTTTETGGRDLLGSVGSLLTGFGSLGF